MTTTSYLAKFGINGSHVGRGLRYLPAKPVAPAEPVTGCDDCDNGCHCESAPGCGHWCCWSAKGEQANTCPAAAAHREHMEAYKTYREALYAYQQTSHLR